MERKKYNDPSVKHRDTETWKKIRQRLTAIKLLCADGATNGQIAEYLGVSIYTIVTYRKRYPEFDECFVKGRAEVVDKLESKMYQMAMGVVDKNITRETVTEEILEEDDPDTGGTVEVVKTKRKRTNYKENGFDTPDISAIEFMLRNLAPEKYNVQPESTDTGIEPVQIVDDIPKDVDINNQQYLYDDSEDVSDDE